MELLDVRKIGPEIQAKAEQIIRSIVVDIQVIRTHTPSLAFKIILINLGETDNEKQSTADTLPC